MVSIRRVSLGSAYRYLLKSVAAGDGAAQGANALSRYYASSGTPPGVFVGSGLSALDDGRGVEAGTLVTEDHMANMFAAMADPVSGKPVGGVPKAPAGAVPVAGFDLTFSPPKSVSVAWALGDEDTKAVIHDCHRRAVGYVLAYGEKDVFRSRSGANGIVEEDVAGVVAASFTHWSSRADDPQLHSHVVVWNRAKSLADGRWRTLDSRGLFKATTTLSELHQGVLSDLLTEALGYGWEARARRHSPRPRYEVTGVPEALMSEFSRRADQVDRWRSEAVEAFVAAHGRQPSPVEHMRIRQAATIATRPDKSHRGLSELTEEWRERAGRHVPRERQVAWVASLAGRNDLPLLRSADLADPILADAAEAVLAEVAERHATFSRMNLLAEAHRVLHGARFASPDERVDVAERVTALAAGASVALAPAGEAHVPRRYQRPDGSSRLRPESRLAYTTQALLDAEARLLEAGRDSTGPSVAGGNGGSRGRRQPQRPRLRPQPRPGRSRREGGHLGTGARRAGRPGRDGEIDHHGRAAGRLGGRARPWFGARPRPLGGRRRGAGPGARHRHREHGQVAHRMAPCPRTGGPPGAAGRAPPTSPPTLVSRWPTPPGGGGRPRRRSGRPETATGPTGGGRRGQPGRDAQPGRAGERGKRSGGQGAAGGGLGATLCRRRRGRLRAPGARPGRARPSAHRGAPVLQRVGEGRQHRSALGARRGCGHIRGPWPALGRRAARDARAAVPVVESRRGDG